jgi:hypothetical protein
MGMTEMSATEIHARVSALPAVPVIMALDMLHCQGWKPNADELAAIKARADFFESMDMDRSVHIRVVDVYTGAKIGTMIYNA